MPGEEFTQQPVEDSSVAARKKQLRATVLTARRGRDGATRARGAKALATHVLTLPQVRPGACVAAYVSTGSEPGTAPLLEALRAHGARVLLPVLLPDGDLDWAPYAGPEALAEAGRGLREPTTARLGPDAISDADLVLVPGLAVSSRGERLGRGGGSYDRALARVGDAFVVVLLHPEEVGLEVPVEAHDRAVDAALTSDGLTVTQRSR